ncbi:MAG: flagellar export chaperone FliS [Candidatus Nitrospinota bacterium M3_3B_026]
MSEYKRPNAYQANQVNTVNKSKLIVLMYDGAIRFIAEAKQRMDTGDAAGQGLYISKAQKIISELAASLDKTRGGDVADSLDRLYTDINRNLTQANIDRDKDLLDTALDTLRNVKQAWEQAIESANKAAPRTGGGPNGSGVAINC